MPEPRPSNWHRATLAQLTREDCRVLLRIVLDFERTFGRDISADELVQALRGD